MERDSENPTPTIDIEPKKIITTGLAGGLLSPIRAGTGMSLKTL